MKDKILLNLIVVFVVLKLVDFKHLEIIDYPLIGLSAAWMIKQIIDGSGNGGDHNAKR